MPFLPASLSVTANTMARSAVLPEVMNCFTPLITYWSPRRSARVVMAEASEPVCGSVRQNAPRVVPWASGFRNATFCAAVPKPFRMPAARLVTETMVEVAPSPAAISSMASASAV
jgi:hypothetical protein